MHLGIVTIQVTICTPEIFQLVSLKYQAEFAFILVKLNS